MPLISVIVPVYKVEPYLRRCVDSILAQTFTDFEVILIDDGSPDNCGKICDEYAENDDRVRVIHQNNGGLSAARNAGIDWAFAKSDSKWLSFVDSDDWVHPDYLHYLLRAVQVTGGQLSACGIRRVNDDSVDTLLEPFCVSSEPWDQFYLKSWIRGVVAYNKLYNKNLFTELRYPIGKLHEDEYLTYKLLFCARTVSVVNAELYFYYQNPEGIIKSGFSLAKMDVIRALEEQCLFAKKNKYIAFYENKRDALLHELVKQISLCNDSDLNRINKGKGLGYLRKELRWFLISERKYIAQKQERKWYYELAFPRLMWCYWVLNGMLRKIKKEQ